MSFGRHDRKYNFSSSLPKFQPNIFIIPDEYRPVVHQCLEQIPNDERPSNLEALLFYMIQFGGAEISKGKEPQSSWFESKRGDKINSVKCRPSQKLIELLNSQIEDFEHQHLQRDWSRMKVNDTLTSQLNEFYSNEVRLSLPSQVLGAPSNWEELLRNFHSIPFLRPSENSGGRLFHKGVSYQMVPKSLRSKLEINGNSTTERDISSAALRFLYLTGKDSNIEFPQELVTSDDAYEIFIQQDLSREEAKGLTYALIFSSKDKEERAVTRKLQSNERFRDSEDLKMRIPHFFEALDAYKQIHKAPHLPLFAKETQFTREVIRRCLNTEVPILPIHDSYITQRSREGDLVEILTQSQQELYGDSFPLRFSREY
ncbi:MAG: hypothetical protein ACLFPL_02155 [Candidatus Nanoarchaeia archaeon]